jgi:ApaG protein
MESRITKNVEVQAESFFLEEHSNPEDNYFVFAYKIRIKNHGSQTLQLLSRHWIITDSNGKVEEVQGEGVIGEQPVLEEGEEFEYTSGSHLKTKIGTMHGNYQMVNEQGENLDVEIPCFTLSIPGIIN